MATAASPEENTGHPELHSCKKQLAPPPSPSPLPKISEAQSHASGKKCQVVKLVKERRWGKKTTKPGLREVQKQPEESTRKRGILPGFLTLSSPRSRTRSSLAPGISRVRVRRLTEVHTLLTTVCKPFSEGWFPGSSPARTQRGNKAQTGQAEALLQPWVRGAMSRLGVFPLTARKS